MASGRVELDANAVTRMTGKDLEQLHVWVRVNVDAALTVGQEEKVTFFVPGDFVDLELELFLFLDLVRFGVDEGDQVFFVAHGDGFAVWRPV